MAGITTAVCNSFKTELLDKLHNFAGAAPDTFKMALIKPSPAGTFDKNTTNYSSLSTDEVTDTSGNNRYTAGGFTLTGVAVALSVDTATIDWTTDPNWGPDTTLSAAGALIYNSSQGNKAVGVWLFDQTYTCTRGTLTITLPAADSTHATLRLT